MRFRSLFHPVVVTIVVFGCVSVAPHALAADTVAPQTTISVPHNNATLTAGTVTVSGTATDNAGVAAVEVAIRNRQTGLWLRADGTWGSFTWIDATTAAPGNTTTTWTHTFTAPAAPYALGARARDTSSIYDPTPQWVGFALSGAAPDTQPPNTTATVPQPNATLPAGTVTVSGTATDNAGIAAVEVAIRNRQTGLWLRADGTWGSFTWIDATTAAPGNTTTTWTHTFTAPAAPYTLGARARDTSSIYDPTPAWVQFSLTGTAPDTQPPNTTATVPQPNATLPAGTVTVSGTATDNAGVAAVEVAIRNRQTGLWLRADGTWGSFTWIDATTASPGNTTTTWTHTFTAPAAPYTLEARARDTASLYDPTPASVEFTLGEPPEGRPDIVLILTDDQRFDTLSAMPNVKALLADHGVSFPNGFVVNALCCPSRATILKGAYSHTTRVYQNSGTYGPFPGFDDSSTIATWLDAAGYRTSMVGKYFNDYPPERGSYIPPGWDRWVAFATDDVGGGRYYDYYLSVDGTLNWYGTDPDDYSTDVLRAEAESFIRQTPSSEPLFLYFAPYGPHEPATAAPRHSSAFPNLSSWRPPNYNEADVSDKPAYIRSLPSLGSTSRSRIDTLRRKQLQSLLSIDEAVAGIVQSLSDTGRLSNTMIVFMSDNGFLWGEHRWGATGAQQKQVPYEESIRVPFVIRYDPLTSGPRTDPRMALSIDLAPTFAELAGVGAPGAEGTSLLPALGNSPPAGREDFLVEHHVTNVPSYCAVRTVNRKYVQYAGGDEELYALDTDPYELVNRASDPGFASTLTTLRTRAHTLCTPPPPGFVFSH